MCIVSEKICIGLRRIDAATLLDLPEFVHNTCPDVGIYGCVLIFIQDIVTLAWLTTMSSYVFSILKSI